MATAAPSSIDLSPSRERDNHVRLARLIISGGTTVLRAVLDNHHPPRDLAKNLNYWKSVLKKKAQLTRAQKKILYPASGDPVSNNFDLSLLYKLLSNVCKLTEPACKWDGFPSNGDISLEDDIVRLRNYRNEVYGHVLSEMAISSEDFTKYWEDISEVLLRINNRIPNKIDPRDLDKEMSNLKVGPITQDDKYHILQEIQETLSDHTEALSRIEKQGDEMGKRLESLEDMKNTTTKTDNKTTTINNNNTITTNNFNFNIDQATLERSMSLRDPASDCLMGSALSRDLEETVLAHDWRFPNEQRSFERNQESCTPQKPSYSNSAALKRRSFEEYNRSGRRDQALSQGDLPFQELASNDGRILHINIRIRGNRNQDCHLGELISKSLSYDQKFRSYLLQSRQLTIEKVDNQDDIHCCIGVSADDLESLKNIWRDCMTNDLREIIKETVLPSDFDGKLEVTIDVKEYEQCCKRLTPKDLGEMRSYHSQSFDVNQTQEEDVDYRPRCQSLGELSSSSKTASDELYLLLCKHGGKLHYTEVMKQLSQNGRTEIEKAMIQKNMETRFRILPGSFIQARLNFCAKKICATNICPNLHLCRYNLLAGCTFPGNCKNSHDITDHHTNRIFRDANLSSLTAEERSNLLKNIAYTVPEICRFYNTPGNKSTCKHNDDCWYLHVCKHWVNSKCLFNKPNKKCSRAHTFDNPTTQKILKESNLHELSEHEVKLKLYKQNI